ncbi:MAG: peptide-methionine (S)-S-oxide reductase MsrA [Paracoccaceae bacterium]
MPRFLLAAIALVFATLPLRAENIQVAVFAGGCFWCVEADFDKVQGVSETISGFTGGEMENPTYSGNHEGHYEAVQITFDADVVSYEQLLHAFFRSIDPLDANGQFCDRGHEYKTAVFASDDQRAAAEAAKAQAGRDLNAEVVTEILPAAAFWPVDGYHQNYHNTNRARYEYYRNGCGRDRRVLALWGDAAPFANR